MEEFEFVDDFNEKQEEKPSEVFPNITRVTDNESKPYYDIWRLSFEEFSKRYPNMDIDENEFNEFYKELGQDYADHMESMISASR